MASISNTGFAVDKTSVRTTMVQVASTQETLNRLLDQFEKTILQTEDDWENSFTASFRSNASAYIKNVRAKQIQMTNNLTNHLLVTITMTESNEKKLTSNASLFDT